MARLVMAGLVVAGWGRAGLGEVGFRWKSTLNKLVMARQGSVRLG